MDRYFPILFCQAVLSSGQYLSGLTQDLGLIRQASLICTNPFKIREDWRRLADKKALLHKSCLYKIISSSGRSAEIGYNLKDSFLWGNHWISGSLLDKSSNLQFSAVFEHTYFIRKEAVWLEKFSPER